MAGDLAELPLGTPLREALTQWNHEPDCTIAARAFVLRYASMIRGTPEGDALIQVSGLSEGQLEAVEKSPL